MRVIAVLLAISGCTAGETDLPPPCKGKCDGDGAGATEPARLRDHLLANLIAQMDRGTVMFGHQRFNITGVNADGTQWLATEGAVERSDANTVAGQHPVVMGIDAWDLAIKPESWAPTPAVHAEAAKSVFAHGGLVVMDWHMRGCATTTTFNAAGNEQCLCKLANDDAYARTWLIEQNYKILADALVRYGLDRIPIVFRPLHEMDGNWFWWGKPYWSCAGMFTGGAAYQKLFRMIVEYLRVERGLSNVLFAYSPGRAADYLAGYPGDAYVDVLGLDLYYQANATFAAQTSAFRSDLSTLASIAYAHGKAAALTEVGNTLIATRSDAVVRRASAAAAAKCARRVRADLGESQERSLRVLGAVRGPPRRARFHRVRTRRDDAVSRRRERSLRSAP